VGEGSEGGGGEGVKGVKDMQQHPGRGGVGHWRISEACKHTVLYLSAHGVFGAAKGYKTKGGKVDVGRALGQRSRFCLHQVSDAAQGALAWRSPKPV